MPVLPITVFNGDQSWGTVGVHPNIIDASWKAVVEGIVLGLILSRGADNGG